MTDTVRERLRIESAARHIGIDTLALWQAVEDSTAHIRTDRETARIRHAWVTLRQDWSKREGAA